MEVMAKGVETAEQYEFLAAEHCQQFQGYLFGRPTPLAEFEALLGAPGGVVSPSPTSP